MFLACHAEADKRRQVLKQKKTRILREHFELSVTPLSTISYWLMPRSEPLFGVQVQWVQVEIKDLCKKTQGSVYVLWTSPDKVVWSLSTRLMLPG